MQKLKKGLVLEGGGIRSAYLAGVLLAFHERKLNDFDVVTGSSAGACCGANFIAGEPEKNRTILEDYLTGDRFVRYRHIFSKQNIVDIDYFIDDVCGGFVPLNIKLIRQARAILYITAMDYATGHVQYFNNREHNIHEALRASCAMPYLYKNKAIYKGRRYLDGGMVASIPLQKALDDGCQEIIVVGTRERSYRKSKTLLPQWLYNLCCRDNPKMGHFFHRRHLLYNQVFDTIQNPPQGVRIHYIAPKSKLPVSRTTRRKDKVKMTVEIGYEDGREFLISPKKSTSIPLPCEP